MSSDTQIDPIKDLLAEYTKQTLIANAWLFAPGVRYQDVAKLLDVSNEHARQTYRALEAGDIEIETVAEPAVQERLGELLEERGLLETVRGPIKVRESPEEIPDWWRQGKRASSNTKTESNIGEETLPGKAKDRLLAAWYFVMAADKEIINNDLAKIAGCSEEHARRVRNAAENGEIEDADFEAISEAVWEVVFERLLSEDMLNPADIEESEFANNEFDIGIDISKFQRDSEKAEPQERPAETADSREREKRSLMADTSAPPDGMGSPEIRHASTPDGMVSVDEIRRVRDILDVLRREAQASDDVKAEFIANEAVLQLDRLLNDAEDDAADA